MCVLGYLLGSEGMDGVRRRGGISKTVGIEDRPRHAHCRREGDVMSSWVLAALLKMQIQRKAPARRYYN